MKTSRSRETIFSGTNQKLVTPPTSGKKRTAEIIFASNGFSTDLRKTTVPATLSTIPEEKKASYQKRNVLTEEIPTRRSYAKGAMSRDLLNQSVDFGSYGAFSSKKMIDHPSKHQSTYSQYDLASLKYHEPEKKERVSKYMNSTGMKQSLALPQEQSKPHIARTSTAYMNSNGMKDILTSPKNGTFKCLITTAKVGSKSSLNQSCFI